MTINGSLERTTRADASPHLAANGISIASGTVHVKNDKDTPEQPVETDTEGVVMKRQGSRFGGLAAAVEESIASSIGKSLGDFKGEFAVTKEDLSQLANDRNRQALVEILVKAIPKDGSVDDDVENPSQHKNMYENIRRLVQQLKEDLENAPYAEHSPEEHEADKRVDMAVNIVTSLLLRSSPETGIDPREVDHRREIFGTNAIAEKPLESFFRLCWEALQDFVLIMLLVLGTITIVLETTESGPCGACWAEGTAILLTVLLVVLLTASIDYMKQFSFRRLSRSLLETNTKAVVRDGKQVIVIDDDIVVGDILSVNSHALASILRFVGTFRRLENGRIDLDRRVRSSQEETWGCHIEWNQCHPRLWKNGCYCCRYQLGFRKDSSSRIRVGGSRRRTGRRRFQFSSFHKIGFPCETNWNCRNVCCRISVFRQLYYWTCHRR
jgi:hypothetical protein